MEYLIKLDDFEGPLDLLLHLVKESNIDICDIKIEDITSQYMEYIHAFEKLDIDIASSYLVMAATLMEIKVRSILPQDDSSNSLEDEVVETRESLIEKLTLYQKYKDITKDFKKLESDRMNFYTKSPEKLNQLVQVKLVNDTNTTVDDLTAAFYSFLKRKDMEKPIATKVTNKEYSVKERKSFIKEYLSSHGSFDFFSLFDSYHKDYIIANFLAILEMAKEDMIVIRQEDNFSKIMIEQKVLE